MKHLILFVFITLSSCVNAQWRDYNLRIDKSQDPHNVYVMLSDNDSTSSYFGRGSWTILSDMHLSETVNYDSIEQVWPRETFFGDTIYWRTWYFSSGHNANAELPGLTPDSVFIVNSTGRSDNISTGVSDNLGPIQYERGDNYYEVYMANQQYDIFITVWYLKI